MPTSVLEAMCFGMPIVTRPVGGLVDFFENDKMGQMISSYDAADFIQPIETLLSNKEYAQSVMKYNHKYGTTHFLASQVSKRLEQIMRKI